MIRYDIKYKYMPSFKPKNNKKFKYNKKSSITLDGKHKEFLNEFCINETDKIPSLKNEKIESFAVVVIKK